MISVLVIRHPIRRLIVVLRAGGVEEDYLYTIHNGDIVLQRQRLCQAAVFVASYINFCNNVYISLKS